MNIKVLAAAAAVALFGTAAQAATIGTIEATNAYDNGTAEAYVADVQAWYDFVGSKPTAVSGNTATVGAGTELPGFIFFYDIDATGNDIEFTLVDNTFNDVGVPAGEADVYFLEFDKEIAAASLESADSNFTIEIEVIAAGTTFDMPDLADFNGGSDYTMRFENGGIAVRVAGGTTLDDSVLGNSFTVSVAPVPVPAALPLFLTALGGIAFVARRKSA